jgi:hypothetical protein
MSIEDELTPAERELEMALRSLRPTAARINPVAAALAAGRRTAPDRLRFWPMAAAAAAVVIGGGAWLTLALRAPMQDRVERHAIVIEPNLAADDQSPLEPPTLIAYRQALARSPAELDALLDRQATTGVTPNNQFTPVGVLMLWNAAPNASRGEM